MSFKKFLNIKTTLKSIFISVLLSLISTYFYTTFVSGKIKISAKLIENHSFDTFFIFQNFSNNNYFLELLDEVRLENLINSLLAQKNTKYKLIDIDLNTVCKKGLAIDIEKINKKIFILQVFGNANEVNDINSCILSLHEIINDILTEKLKQLDVNVKFIYNNYRDLFISDESSLINLKKKEATIRLFDAGVYSKRPVRLDNNFETYETKKTGAIEFFAGTFIFYLIIMLAIFNRRKILLYFKNST